MSAVPAGPPRILLEVESLRAGYGNIEVLHEVSIALEERTLCAIVGANGAGKTTLLMALAGVMPTRGGHVRFDGAEITRLPSHARVGRGLVLVPEGRRMLPGMSVEENLQVAASVSGAAGFGRIEGLFDRFPILRTRRNLPAGSLSGGEQQMLAIGRALMVHPRLLLLDEPSLGLAPRLAAEIFNALGQLNKRGLTILVVEQKAPLALALANRAYVMRTGKVIATPDPKDITSPDALAHLYLGEIH